MNWLESNFDEHSYHLREIESHGDTHGDSLHHTCMIFSILYLSQLAKCQQVKLGDICFEGENLKDLFENELQYFILTDGRLVRSWNGLGWWVNPHTVTRDQTMAFVLASWIFGVFKNQCTILYLSLKKNFWFFPNNLYNRTLQQKKWWLGQLPDFLAPDTLGLFSRATGSRSIFPWRWLSDIFLVCEAVLMSLYASKTDHVKFVVKCISLDLLENNFYAKLASFIFVNFRRNGKGPDGFNCDEYKLGHPVLNVWMRYWRPDAGHAKEIYEVSEPLLKWWINRYKWRSITIKLLQNTEGYKP